MAATIGGAIKAYLEAQGLGIAVYKDAPPQAVRDKATGRIVAPYCTYHEDIVPLRMRPMEDGGPANGGTAIVTQTFQLDLWQNWRAADDTNLESPTLADAITRLLHGSKLLPSGAGAPPVHVAGVRQVGRIRIEERDPRIVHHAYTLAIDRVI